MNYFNEKNVLITGGLGFVGSNLALRLRELGANITIADKNTERLQRLSPYETDFEIVQADIRKYSNIENLVLNKEIVFHLAAQTSHLFSMKEPIIDTEINVIGTLNILEAIRKKNDKAKFILTSTKGVTGVPETLPVVEGSHNVPLDVYSTNKLILEKYCHVYQHHYNLSYSILRLTNIFGPRQQISTPSLGILNYFIGKALKDEEITIYGDGMQKRDYNYISNTLDALLLCASKNEANGEIFYLGTNRGILFKNMAQKIVDIAGSGSIRFVPYPETAKKIEIGDFVVDSSKLQNMLKWKPKISFEKGLELTIDFYKKNPEYFDM